ncbi:CpsD/CapB family tyrosine-protein kinase [Bacillus sp. AGMB 02131]|uniref:non-specific protein-tyrosine kinase n=1 Tax=Peribacillus faecalis TaxID=2772559 RepID=A0A927CYW8_9BACI|nr:CpsD/CapB family tyrosine-protein kinase [Peribacillus faecalis]MBD3108285.1 CpsD/CapB family tyrosine-protein kinase [Peribacillus faecalis]
MSKKNTLITQKRKLITSLPAKSLISEQYRTIRTNIQFSTPDLNVHSILVTSSLPGEGKSTTAANIAIVFAQQGKKVLLIDTDLRKPTVHYTFNFMNVIGLTNILIKSSPINEAVKSTDIDNLDVLTSGPIPPNPSELLASEAMKQLMKELYYEYDILIFDTPPILTVTDAQILANICDASIIVISSGKTEINDLKKATNLLQNASGKFLGAVLNNKKMKKHHSYYAY